MPAGGTGPKSLGSPNGVRPSGSALMLSLLSLYSPSAVVIFSDAIDFASSLVIRSGASSVISTLSPNSTSLCACSVMSLGWIWNRFW